MLTIFIRLDKLGQTFVVRLLYKDGRKTHFKRLDELSSVARLASVFIQETNYQTNNVCPPSSRQIIGL